MSHPITLLIADHILGKKVSLIVFKTQILPKSLPVMRILSFTILTYLKKLIGIKSLNTKQCPAGYKIQNNVQGMRVGVLFFKNRGVNFPPKKVEVIMRE